MPPVDNSVRITLSVLDRLLDYEPEIHLESPLSRSRSLRHLKQAIKRDLEWLLNTRQYTEEIPPALKEVHRSVVAYGLPDFTSTSVKDPDNQYRLIRAIETIIGLFEPRLEAVSVTLDTVKDTDRVLRFRIDGQLKVDPAPEPVTFDSFLESGGSQFVIKGE
jgi:type VI secretion system protein ImpF